MAGLDHERIAMVVARPATGGVADQSRAELATGYFLTGDLVLTARHIADTAGSAFRVRSEIGGVEERDHWSDAVPVWFGVGDVDAMLFRTSKWFEDWETPPFGRDVEQGSWESTGYAKVALDSERGDRKTLPLRGNFDLSGGQGDRELALTTEQTIAAEFRRPLEGNLWRAGILHVHAQR